MKLISVYCPATEENYRLLSKNKDVKHNMNTTDFKNYSTLLVDDDGFLGYTDISMMKLERMSHYTEIVHMDGEWVTLKESKEQNAERISCPECEHEFLTRMSRDNISLFGVSTTTVFTDNEEEPGWEHTICPECGEDFEFMVQLG